MTDATICPLAFSLVARPALLVTVYPAPSLRAGTTETSLPEKSWYLSLGVEGRKAGLGPLREMHHPHHPKNEAVLTGSCSHGSSKCPRPHNHQMLGGKDMGSQTSQAEPFQPSDAPCWEGLPSRSCPPSGHRPSQSVPTQRLWNSGQGPPCLAAWLHHAPEAHAPVTHCPPPRPPGLFPPPTLCLHCL